MDSPPPPPPSQPPRPPPTGAIARRRRRPATALHPLRTLLRDPPPQPAPCRAPTLGKRQRNSSWGFSFAGAVDAEKIFQEAVSSAVACEAYSGVAEKVGAEEEVSPKGAHPIPEDADADETEQQNHALDKNFGYNKNFGAKYELGKEAGIGHFGHTCYAKGRKGELKDMPLAVKIISKAKVV